MKKFIETCRKLFDSPLVVVDIGAAGGVKEIQGLAPLCEIHAVEPREDSFQELEQLREKSSYSKICHYNKGLANTPGFKTLYVTRIPEASSMYRPNTSLVNRWRHDGALDIMSEVQIDCMTLDQMLTDAAIEYVDLIKIDVQGSELDILLGAGDYLEKISIIKCEVEFVELYQGQPLFDDIVRALSQRGFRFVNFFDGGHSREKRIWGDSLFIKKRLDVHDRLIKAAAILVEMGYYEEAKWLLLDHEEKTEILELMIEAFTADRYPHAILLRSINNALKNAGTRILILEKIRQILSKLLVRTKLGRTLRH